MPQRLLGKIAVLLVTLWVAATPLKAVAHPHAWIDLRSKILFDDDGRMTGLELEWLFGDFYSAYVLQDVLAGKT